jgi:hypothetical protein
LNDRDMNFFVFTDLVNYLFESGISLEANARGALQSHQNPPASEATGRLTRKKFAE